MTVDQNTPRPVACERAREWASLVLDGELSELESSLLERHVARCTPCAAFAAEIRELTALLRCAPAQRLPAPVSVAPLRRRSVGVFALRAGAAAAVVVGALGLAGSITLSDPSGQQVPEPVAAPADEVVDRILRESQRSTLTPPLPYEARRSLGITL